MGNLVSIYKKCCKIGLKNRIMPKSFCSFTLTRTQLQLTFLTISSSPVTGPGPPWQQPNHDSTICSFFSGNFPAERCFQSGKDQAEIVATFCETSHYQSGSFRNLPIDAIFCQFPYYVLLISDVASAIGIVSIILSFQISQSDLCWRTWDG